LDELNILGSITSILSAVFALFAWLISRKTQNELQYERKRQNKKVTVTLQYGAKQIKLPIALRRSELTRAEVLGRIGMIPMREKGKRFSIAYLNTSEFLKQINSIIENSTDEILTIPCDEREFHQFDFNTYA